MTAMEACHLVLPTTTINSKGNIFILNMGKPINILNLAEFRKNKMKLNNNMFLTQRDWLKPGEKLNETLKDDKESLRRVSKEIFMVYNKKSNIKKFSLYFEKLKDNFFKSKKIGVIKELKNIIRL